MVMGSISTLVRVFLCPCVGPVPSVGLTLTWFIWDRNQALQITLYSVNSVLIGYPAEKSVFLSGFAQGQGQKSEQNREKKKLVEFHNQPTSINYGAVQK